MRLTETPFPVWLTTVTMMVLGGLAADEPKPDAKTAVKQLQGVWRPETVTVYGKKQSGIDLDTFKAVTLEVDKVSGTVFGSGAMDSALKQPRTGQNDS
jgi:hypothetical protein